jgi:hypothetical protein
MNCTAMGNRSRARALRLLTWLVLAAPLSSTYVGTGEAQATDRSHGFLTPLDPSLFLPPDHPRVRRACRNNDSETVCPQFLKYGSDEVGPGPFIAPVFSAYAPHLLVTFTFWDVTNIPITSNGVRTFGLHLTFFVDSAVSDVERPTEFSGSGVAHFPGEVPPGTTATYPAIHWRAIVLNGCVSPPAVIPIDFRNRITSREDNLSPSEEIGVFDGADDTSLVSTGFWNVGYDVRATDSDGGSSNLRVRGTMSVVCSAEPDF